MIEKTWLVQAIAIGISYNDFWQMNPRIIKLHIDAHKQWYEEQNTLMYIQGRYFADAIMATVCNMFRGQGHKPYEFPKEPYKFEKEEERELTPMEKDLAVKQLFAELQQMKENFDKKHPKS